MFIFRASEYIYRNYKLTMLIFLSSIEVQKINMHLSKKTLEHPVEVHKRLDELCLTLEQVRSVVDAMVSGRANSTANDPSSAPGLLSWIHGTRRLREVTLPNGWEKDDHDQQPSVVSPNKTVRLSVMNTDDGTGIADRLPQPTSKKGTATERAAYNNQREFIEDHPSFFALESQSSPRVVQWYLMVYSKGEDLRAELSCPTSCEEGGFSSFQERIFISMDLGGDTPIRGNQDSPVSDPDFEITVERKSS